jgi:cytochrome P450
MPGLLNSQNEAWRRQRQATNPIVGKHQSIARYMPIHSSIMNDFVKQLKIASNNPSSPFEIYKFENNISLLIIESGFI